MDDDESRQRSLTAPLIEQAFKDGSFDALDGTKPGTKLSDLDEQLLGQLLFGDPVVTFESWLLQTPLWWPAISDQRDEHPLVPLLDMKFIGILDRGYGDMDDILPAMGRDYPAAVRIMGNPDGTGRQAGKYAKLQRSLRGRQIPNPIVWQRLSPDRGGRFQSTLYKALMDQARDTTDEETVSDLGVTPQQWKALFNDFDRRLSNDDRGRGRLAWKQSVLALGTSGVLSGRSGVSLIQMGNDAFHIAMGYDLARRTNAPLESIKVLAPPTKVFERFLNSTAANLECPHPRFNRQAVLDYKWVRDLLGTHAHGFVLHKSTYLDEKRKLNLMTDRLEIEAQKAVVQSALDSYERFLKSALGNSASLFIPHSIARALVVCDQVVPNALAVVQRYTTDERMKTMLVMAGVGWKAFSAALARVNREGVGQLSLFKEERYTPQLRLGVHTSILKPLPSGIIPDSR